MTLMDFSIFPLDKGASVSTYVARCVDLIDRSGMEYRLHAMGTVVEGELGDLLKLVQLCFDALSQDCDRITCHVKLDYRSGTSGRITQKVHSVESKLERD